MNANFVFWDMPWETCALFDSQQKNATKAKPLSEATAKDVIPQVTWIWRFSWDHVQQKMTARKPFPSLGTDVKMTKGQCIKLTIWAARAIKEFSWGMEMETWESIIKWGTEDNTFLHITDLERLQWFIGGPCLRGILDFSMTGQGHQSQADAGWDSQAPWSWVKPTRQAQMSGMKEPDKPFLEARRIKKGCQFLAEMLAFCFDSAAVHAVVSRVQWWFCQSIRILLLKAG